MKEKTTLILFALVLSFSVFSQNDDEIILFVPTSENFTIELDFLPFNDNGPVNLNSFRGRYFINENLAARIGFNIDSKKDILQNATIHKINDNDVIVTEETKQKYNVLGITLGAEYHPIKTHRVSPYVGLEIGYESKSSKKTEDKIDITNNDPFTYETLKLETTNAWSVIHDSGYDFHISERAYNTIKANIILGSDIYILKHFYMGVELGIGFNSVKYKEVELKYDDKLIRLYPKNKKTTFGLNFNNAIRIGFWI